MNSASLPRSVVSEHEDVAGLHKELRAVVTSSRVAAEVFPEGPNWAVASAMGWTQAARSASALRAVRNDEQPPLMPWGMNGFPVGAGVEDDPV